MATAKGFAPSVEVFVPTPKPRRHHPHHKEVVDRTVYKRPPTTPAQEQLAAERKQALGWKPEDDAVWGLGSKGMAFACLGTDRKINRIDMLGLDLSTVAAIARESSESRKNNDEMIRLLREKLAKAQTPVEVEAHTAGIRKWQRVIDTYVAFDFAADAIKACHRAATEAAYEEAKTAMQRVRDNDAEQYENIVQLKKENKALRKKVERLAQKQTPVAIPELPPAPAEPRDVATLRQMLEDFGDSVIVNNWSGEEYHAFLQSCKDQADYYSDMSIDYSITEDNMRKHEEEAAIERIHDAIWDADKARSEYKRLHRKYGGDHTPAAAVAIQDDRYDEELQYYDSDQRKDIYTKVCRFIREMQRADNATSVIVTHAILCEKFNDAEKQGEWCYLPDDHELCNGGSTTRFKEQLSHVLNVMVQRGDLLRPRPRGLEAVAARKFR